MPYLAETCASCRRASSIWTGLLLLGPQHSGGTLQGTGPTTTLRNSFSAGVGENGTLQAGGTGISSCAGRTSNAAVGEHRRVLGTDPATGRVTLDRAVTRGYADAALALVEPVANLTIRRLTLAQPAEPRANPLFVQFCVGLRVVNVYSKDEKATTCCLAQCGDATLTDCEVNGLMVNVSHDTTVDGGVYTQVYGEEASTTTKLSNLTIKANTVQPANGITWHTGSDRLTLSRVRIEGFGTVVPGSGGSNAFNIGGRGLQMWDVTVAMINGVGAGYLGGDDGTVLRLVSNTPLTIQAGKGWRVVDSSSPGWDLRAGTTGVASGTPFVPSAPGWHVSQ